MNYLLSGVTSFTGIHLLERLINDNNNVICITSRDIKDVESKKYEKIRSIRENAKTRLDFIRVDYTENINIGMIDTQIDGFISHGYFVNDYKNLSVSPFDIAIKSTIWMKELKKQLDERGCKSIAVTGTYFSNFKNTLQTPYSVSKTIAWEYIKLIFKQYNMLYYLFPNPYGIYESQKLSYHFINSMINNEDFNLGDPYSIRDNIPVEFLVDDYYNNIVKITEEQKEGDDNIKISSPSYIQQSNIEYLKSIMTCFLKAKSSTTKIILPNITPKPSLVTGRKSIRDLYINLEEGILEKYISSYTNN